LIQLPVFPLTLLVEASAAEVKMIDFGMAVKYDHGVWFKAGQGR
jgi:hypothetical protein